MLKHSSQPQGLFITGTDTGIGKTFVSALLCRLFKKDKSIKYYKPIQTGSATDDDTRMVMVRAQLSLEQIIAPTYRFSLPASPDRAAEAEGAEIDTNAIIKTACDNKGHFLIVEGAGGIEVPIRKNYRMSDLARELELPAVVVASTRLGTINHTLLTVKDLRFSGVPVLGVVLCGEEDKGLREVLERENVAVLAHIPRVPSHYSDWESLTNFLEPVRAHVDTQTLQKNVSTQDAKTVWHPFTQHKTEKDFPSIQRGQGTKLYTEAGHKLLDATSSWWVNLHGHSHPEIAQAIATQASTLEHVIFAGYTHQPAVDFSIALLEEAKKLNPEWSRVFFSDNGSTAVEVALKMAFQYQELRGEKRKKFLALNHSYHGDTLGAMSVSDRGGYHKYFLPLMMPVDHIEPGDFEQLEKCVPHMNEYAACIVEPLVQGAGGMRMYSSDYLRQLQKYCRAHGVLLIADEIFTGFGRTGAFLASILADFKADLVCLSKGITGGFLPLSVTLTTEAIFDEFLRDSKAQAFLHGHSYTANPIACAAALKSLEILKRSETQERIQALSEQTKAHLEELQQKHTSIVSVRSLGTIGALDLKTNETYFTANLSQQISKVCFEQGVLLRPLGATIYTVPPYSTTDEELDFMYGTISQAITEVIEKGVL